MLSFQTPENLAVAAAVLIMLAGFRRFTRKSAPLDVPYFPGLSWLRQFKSPGRLLRPVSRTVLWMATGLLAIGVMRPELKTSREEVAAKGVDIVLALDISTSMSARDYSPGCRLEAARGVVRDFIRQRASDRMALVVFAAESYVICPLTADRYSLEALLETVELIPFESDGTAIGLALVSSVNRLRESPSRRKVVVLLTDGVNNRGEISPLQAAEFCQRYGIRVYTVGLGSRGETGVLARAADGAGVYIQARVEFDSQILQEIARKTGGRSFVASDSGGLRQIYGEIDAMEKTVLEKKHVEIRQDLTPSLALASLLGVLVSVVLMIRHPACL